MTWFANWTACSGASARDPGESGLEVPLGVLVPLALGLGATYGFFMGWYAALRHWGSAR